MTIFREFDYSVFETERNAAKIANTIEMCVEAGDRAGLFRIQTELARVIAQLKPGHSPASQALKMLEVKARNELSKLKERG